MGKKHLIFEEKKLNQKGQKEGVGTSFLYQQPLDQHNVPPVKKNSFEKQRNEPDTSFLHKKAQEEGEEEGIREQRKEEAKQKEQTKSKLEELDERNNFILFKARTLFPFDLFPDTVVIDTTKISIIRKQFFATHHITTINLKDLVDVAAGTSLFLGNIILTYLPRIESTGMIQPNTETVQMLRKKDALRANYILKGILVAKREKVDLLKIPLEDLATTVERFGKSKESPST